jgi:mxaJ protein
MCSRFLNCITILAAVLVASACQEARSSSPTPNRARVLRVCADPNNLPFSNERGEGFENRLAELIARDMSARLEYTWFAQRRGFIRNTLNAGRCDLVVGIPRDFEGIDTTHPYYHSTYVFVTREEERRKIESLDDPRLRSMKIGVHVVGDDYSNPPPVHALARRSISKNVSGYSIYGDYSQPNPPARLVEAVGEGSIDVAIVWGPIGGYFAARQAKALRVTPVLPETDGNLPFVFAISIGVRKGEKALLEELQGIVVRRKPEIDRILNDYAVPLKRRPHVSG